MVEATAGRRETAPLPYTLSTYLCVEFVNSRFTDHTGTGEVHDRMPLAEWQEWYARRCGITPGQAPGRTTLRNLSELRDTLRALLVSRRAPDDATLVQLNDWAGGAAQFWELFRTKRSVGAQLVWHPADWRAVAAATVVSYARLLADGNAPRVKVCANPDCTWLFFDESRNRSRRWCDPAACGNLVKVRRHRSLRGGQARPVPHRGRRQRIAGAS